MDKKVTIVGAGNVGATIAYTLVASSDVNEIVLIDINKAKSDAEALDIKQSSHYLSNADIKSGDYEDSKDSDIVIITSGIGRKPGQSRLELVQKNIDILKSITDNIVKFSPNAIYIIVSNPVDILTYFFHKYTTIPKNHIIGTGTLLDSMRFKVKLSEVLNKPSKDIGAIVLGEHGDSCVFPWSLTNYELSDLEKKEVEEFVKKSGATIISGKGATFYAIASAVCKVVNCIISDKKEVLPISVMLDGEYGISNVCLGLPCEVSSNGLGEKTPLNLNSQEKEALENSANILKNIISGISF